MDVPEALDFAAPSLGPYGVGDEVRDADASFSGPKEQELVVLKRFDVRGEVQGRYDPGQNDACGALDVVVEARRLVLPVVENPEGVGVAKIFELRRGVSSSDVKTEVLVWLLTWIKTFLPKTSMEAVMKASTSSSNCSVVRSLFLLAPA